MIVSQNLPEWVVEAPEEIDVLLAQREFVEAQRLLLKAERALKKGDIVQSDINRQLNEKRKSLVDILSAELCPAADRSLRAGARGQRKVVIYWKSQELDRFWKKIVTTYFLG